jgi:RHS repeat-associated protein
MLTETYFEQAIEQYLTTSGDYEKGNPQDYDRDRALFPKDIINFIQHTQPKYGRTSFYHTDGLGSTRALTNEQGQVSDTYLYDAYGNLLNSTGTTVNPYRYAGEQYDPILQHYYLRARYYDPSTGRFTSRDPFEGVMREPLSLAKYPYAHGNPVNLTDPSGLFVGYGSTAVTISTILQTAYIIGSVSYLSQTTLEPEFPQEVIDNNTGVRNLARQPISVGGNTRRIIAEIEIEQAAAWDYKPNVQGFPYVVWGSEYQDIFQHDYDALHGKGDTKNPPGKSPAFLAHIRPGWDRSWLRTLIKDANGYDRDEYPYASTAQGGRFNYETNIVSVRLTNKRLNRMQGRNLGRFQTSQLTPNDPLLSWFGVLTIGDRSFWVDRNQEPHDFSEYPQ